MKKGILVGVIIAIVGFWIYSKSTNKNLNQMKRSLEDNGQMQRTNVYKNIRYSKYIFFKKV